MVIVLTPSVRADIPTGSTAVVVTATTSDDPADAEEMAERVQRAARARNVSILGDGADRLVAKHSAPAIRPGRERLDSLRAEVDAVTRHLALGELQQAIKRMKTIETLHHDALDFLSRELKQARKLFQACVMTGYLLHQDGRVEEGKEQMRMCSASFPGYELHKEVFTDAVRTLYLEVTTHRDRRAARLLVEGVGEQDGCFVRLNGIKVGSAPLQIRTRPSTVRVQLECGSGLGRIHTVKLKTGEQKVRIDPGLEAALDTSTSVPILLHLSALSDALVTRQLVELGRAMGVAHVLQVDRVGEEGWALGLVDVEAGLTTARVKIHKDHTGAAVARLFAAPRRAVASAEGASDEGSEGSPSVRLAERSLIGTGQVHGAYFAVTGTVWLLSPIGTMLMLDERRSKVGTINTESVDDAAELEEKNNQNQAVTKAFNRAGMLGFVIAGVPSLWWTVSSMFLPDTGDMPWYSWAAGVVGGAIFGVGLASTLGSDICGLNPDRNEMGEIPNHCTEIGADEYTGPMIMTHAVAPLSIFFSYAIANVLDLASPDTAATLSVDETSASFVLRGKF